MELSLKFRNYCNNIDLKVIKIYKIKNGDKRKLFHTLIVSMIC